MSMVSDFEVTNFLVTSSISSACLHFFISRLTSRNPLIYKKSPVKQVLFHGAFIVSVPNGTELRL